MRGRFFTLSFVALIVGCGGGGGGSSPGPTPTIVPTATPTVAPTSTPTASAPQSSTTIITVQPGPQTVPLAPAGALSASIAFTGMQAAPNTVLTAGLTSYGITPQSIARRVAAAASPTPIFQVTFAANNGLLIGPGTLLTFDLGPAANALTAVQIVVIDDTNATETVGVFDVVNDSVTVQIPQSISVAPGTIYTIQAFVAPAGATPTPIQPTPAPGTIDATLSTSNASAILLENEGGYAGLFEVPAVATSGACAGAPVLTGTYGNSPPAGAPAFTSHGGVDYYLQVTSSCTIVPSGPVDFALTAPSGGLAADVLANGAYQPVAGVAITPFGSAPNGETNFSVNFPASAFSLQAGVPTTFVLYPQSGP